ncbi:MAG: helix-turn-helix domain-containing protein, partial [Candidatus Riesia sp.]|nr:helix-turn-helix domain-containing protein [Candidatus Riesia sp.]
MNLNFKFECFPNKSQQNQLTSIFGQSRFVWNYFLNKEIETHKSTNKFNFFNQNSADLTKLK